MKFRAVKTRLNCEPFGTDTENGCADDKAQQQRAPTNHWSKNRKGTGQTLIVQATVAEQLIMKPGAHCKYY